MCSETGGLLGKLTLAALLVSWRSRLAGVDPFGGIDRGGGLHLAGISGEAYLPIAFSGEKSNNLFPQSGHLRRVNLTFPNHQHLPARPPQ